jgi:hypothetical protein
MTWLAFHHRADVLRAVTDEADRRLDGILPAHLAGVSETFHDDLDLLGALQTRWYTRLSGALERSLSTQPTDFDAAVRDVWVGTAHDLPGIRAIIDAHVETPTTDEMGRALDRAMAKEQVLLATMAGRSNGGTAGTDPRTVEAGRRLQHEARAAYDAGRTAAASPTGTDARPARRATPTGSAAFVERLKAALAAA